VVEDEDGGGEVRYRLLETLREFARERLAASGEDAAVRRRHAACYLALAEAAAPELLGAQQAVWLDRLEQEMGNFRAALTWCAARGDQPDAAETGMRLAAALWQFWDERFYLSEGGRWLETVLRTCGPAAGRTRARVLLGLGRFAAHRCDDTLAAALYEESLALARAAGDARGIAAALGAQGVLALYAGDRLRARTLHAESLALARAAGDARGIAAAVDNLGLAARFGGDYALARSLHEEGLALARAAGDVRATATALNNLAVVARQQGEYTRAQDLAEESLDLHADAADRPGMATALRNLGQIAYLQGDLPVALARLQQSQRLCAAADSGSAAEVYGLAEVLVRLSNVACTQGDYALAQARGEEALSLARRVRKVMLEALALQSLARLAAVQARPAAAKALHAAGLRRFAQYGDRFGIATALEGLAEAAVAQSRWAHGLQLAGAAATLRDTIGAPPAAIERPSLEGLRAEARQALGAQEAAQAWAAGRAMPLEQAVAAALAENTDIV
jgi:tetratricopeptide (TPR) repeat protein